MAGSEMPVKNLTGAGIKKYFASTGAADIFGGERKRGILQKGPDGGDIGIAHPVLRGLVALGPQNVRAAETFHLNLGRRNAAVEEMVRHGGQDLVHIAEGLRVKTVTARTGPWMRQHGMADGRQPGARIEHCDRHARAQDDRDPRGLRGDDQLPGFQIHLRQI